MKVDRTMNTSIAPTTYAQSEAEPESACALYPSPAMPPEERLALNRAFELAGIPVAAAGKLEVHAIAPFNWTEPTDIEAGPASNSALRVRRFGARQEGPIDWAAEVTADLAAWMLTSPPPQGSVIDVVVPAAPGSTAPRLSNGLYDARHIWISARDRQVPPDERDVLRAWARHALEVMRTRWSASGAACPCC